MIPEKMFPISGTKPVTTNGGVTADNISLKNAGDVYIVAHLTQSVGHATVLTPKVGTAVATAATALPANVQIWYGNVSTSTDAIARQTDAKSLTLGGAVTGDVYAIFKIDTATLAAGGYDVLGFTSSDSSQATNFIEVTYWVAPKYQSQVSSMPSFIID
jgi:hypothetical protein